MSLDEVVALSFDTLANDRRNADIDGVIYAIVAERYLAGATSTQLKRAAT